MILHFVDEDIIAGWGFQDGNRPGDFDAFCTTSAEVAESQAFYDQLNRDEGTCFFCHPAVLIGDIICDEYSCSMFDAATRKAIERALKEQQLNLDTSWRDYVKAQDSGLLPGFYCE